MHQGHAVYSKNPSVQAANEEGVSRLLEKLQQTGKPVRISDLSIGVADAEGNLLQANQVSTDDRVYAGDYLAFIMQEYRRIVPEEQQFGISLSSMAESAEGNSICPWTSDYNRNGMYEGIVNGLKDISETENTENE